MIIETRNLVKRYGKTAAVNKLDMNVKKNSVYGFIGRNGAGKTTTLSMLCHVKHPTSGSIKLFDKDISYFKEIQPRLGAFLQNSNLYPDQTALENLTFFAKLKEVKEPKKEAARLISRVGLSSYADSRVKNLSHGIVKLLSIAEALMGSPELIILDEPTNGLDPEALKLVKDLITDLDNKTIVISSHDLAIIKEVCTDIGIIDKGKMIVERKMPKADLEKLFLRSIKSKSIS